jgi:hypothetical protein
LRAVAAGILGTLVLTVVAAELVVAVTDRIQTHKLELHTEVNQAILTVNQASLVQDRVAVVAPAT